MIDWRYFLLLVVCDQRRNADMIHLLERVLLGMIFVSGLEHLHAVLEVRGLEVVEERGAIGRVEDHRSQHPVQFDDAGVVVEQPRPLRVREAHR